MKFSAQTADSKYSRIPKIANKQKYQKELENKAQILNDNTEDNTAIIFITENGNANFSFL